ncbi:acyl-CoA thioester hydrolase/BAAT C-terminal domain-containing protein [Nocardioides sp. CER19]|uniref:acyl-CoA thioester hydrolase/BAAT C-terminal domain-containing protein n=1 Tax=Nocardioides sp. CER19 TaxID=3038538 RepID=UPI0024497792|nr:acyl-CoA thioester hydrolase/BAAT C-terminal domain-containing protein [Nocardioides sp. CER19]MDH2416833.1 acyl-CoA thioester hydrolase/BAAT C-terminal domain-containing protein [Nocardioides sp. CER19]
MAELFIADGGDAVGVLVLAGSSGRVEEDRCRVLAAAGITAASYRWFGDTVDLVPLESFEEPLARLHERCDRLAVLGTSRGAEAALLLGALHAEIDVVVGLAPSDVVWAALGDARPQRSSWTRGGEPLPFVPYDDGWEPEGGEGPPSYVDMYCQSLETYADRVPAARIPVERITGEVVLAAGGDDALWPSVLFAEQVRRRREATGRGTTVVTHAEAGHRVLLPGETATPPRRDLAHGGTPAADAALGRELWPVLLDALRGS